MSEQPIEAPTSERTNERQIIQRLASDLEQAQVLVDQLTVIIDKTNSEIGPRDIKDVARVLRTTIQGLRRILRYRLREYSSVD